MNVPVVHEEADHEDEDAAGRTSVNYLLDLLEMSSRHLALLTALIAMCGSLFFSDVIGWPPCTLCWYQRILMYPLTLILGIGIWRRDQQVHTYVLPLSVLGACTSLNHYLLIRTDWFPPPPCSTTVPCTVDYLNWLGFINIPFLALMAFVIITCMMAAWALLGHPASTTSRLDGARLAVIMIAVSVVLGFMVTSTLI